MRGSGHHGFRPRLQRRDRDGLAPSSLLNPLAHGYLNPLVIKEPEIPQQTHLLQILLKIRYVTQNIKPEKPNGAL
jgi:hypothetical protein